MIVVKEKKKSTKKITPHYMLSYNYMIGDANGDTVEVVEVSKDNPYLEKYVKLLNKLKPTKDTWGLVLDSETLYKCFEEKQISEKDYKFLLKLMFPYNDDLDEDEEQEESNDYEMEFCDGVRGETEYSFLVFQGVDLEYVDEYNERHAVKFVKGK